jgi:hypothetical protein
MAYTTVNKSTDYFNTKLYTGTSGTINVTGLDFQPDWTWIYNRGGTYASPMFDALRGVTKLIESTGNGVENTQSNTLTAFNSDGFTVGADGNSYVNRSSSPNTYVAWNWKAGGAGSSNTDGSVTSTVSANTTSGFSIVKYTNPSSGSPFTVGHGLGAAPKMIMIKNITGSAQNWGVYHTAPGFGKYLQLNTTIDEATANLVTATSNTTFSTYYDHHTAGVDLIAYCFAEIKGFSKIGFYRGNGNADGAFAFCGFKPAFVLFKEYTGAGDANWVIQDSKRVGFNPNNNRIYPNDSAVENTSSFRIDMLSNGFKLRSSDGDANENGNNFLYLAIAEAPLVGSNNVPATAR